MADELKEKAERGVIDNMLSTAQSALAIGAGAVFLYRNGGRKFLSEASGISSRVLGGVREDLSGIGDRKLRTTDVPDLINRAFKNEDSHFKRAREEVADGGSHIRVTDQTSNLGQMYNAFNQSTRRRLNREAGKAFDYQRGIKPLASDYANQLARTDLERRQVRELVENMYHKDDLVEILNTRDRLKLNEIVGANEIEDILASVKRKKEEIQGARDQFARQAERAYEPIQREAFGIEALMEKRRKQKEERALLGDRGLTFGEFTGNSERFRGNEVTVNITDAEGKESKIVEEATAFANRLRDRVRETNKGREEEAVRIFNELNVSELIRVDKNNNIYNFSETMNMNDRLLDRFAATMPGKIFKVRDFRESTKQSSFEIFNPSLIKADPIAAKLINDGENKNLLTLDKQLIRIYDKTYTIGNQGRLNHVQELDNTKLLTKYGAQPGLLMNIAGNEAYRPTTGYKILDRLNIGKEGQAHIGDYVRSMVSKFGSPEWSGNALDSAIKTPEQSLIDIGKVRDMISREAGLRGSGVAEDIQRANVLKETIYKSASDLAQQAQIINSMYSKTSYAPKMEDALKLSRNMIGEAKSYMELAAKDNEELIQAIFSKKRNLIGSTEEYLNQDLASLLYKYSDNPRNALSMLSIKENQGNLMGGNQSDHFMDLLRIELTKESLMRHRSASGDLMSARTLIKDTLTDKDAAKNMNQLMDWTVLQTEASLFARGSSNLSSVEDLLDQSENVFSLYAQGKQKLNPFLEGMHENLEMLRKERVNDFASDYGEVLRNTNIVQAYGQNEFIHIKKMVSPMDLIQDLNDKEKWKAFGKQWFAGRNNMEDVTSATLAPYFFTVRLSDALSKIGLSFGVEDKGSVGSLVSAMVLKRGLPIVGALTAYDYTSDMFGAATGQNLTTTMLSGAANVDLAMRSLTDATGLTDVLKDEKELNPFYRYWTGDEYMSREEREDWYQNGYQEMRKGRWWNFGGIQEFRGSKVQYYQPNYLRRATSNWKDVSIYDNVWDKWSHSWIPTPTNPISPLIYLADPYWMERRFAEDRPYPMTGKMFTEETPWGPILNATVGELVKPQRRMHTDRLDENFVDSKVLIEAENQAVFEKARSQGNKHLVRFKDGAIEPVTFTSYDSPTPSTRLVSISGEGGSYSAQGGPAYGDYSGAIYAGDVSSSNPLMNGGSAALEGGGQGSGGIGMGTVEGLSFEDKIAISSADGNVFSMLAQGAVGAMALGGIGSANDAIFQRAAANRQMEALGMPKEDGVISTESIFRAGASFGSQVLQDAEALSELKGLSAGDDFLGEMAYTMRFAAGIYGYGTYALFPGQPKTKLADASDITSPVRSFWDMNTGGLGGGYLEIFRRFIPSANHKQTDLNPLLNTMPDWMPERFRFGDPYCVSEDTLIEHGKLGFVRAGNIKKGDIITTHKGRHKEVDGLAIRKIRAGETVHLLKITSLSAVEMKFSEEHPILVLKNPTQRRQYSDRVKSPIHRQANAMIEAMRNGTFSKKELAKAAGIATNDSWRIFKMMQEDNIVFNYKSDKFQIIPKRLKSYDIDMIEKGLYWKKAKDVKAGDYVAYPVPRFEDKEVVLDLSDYLSYPCTDKYIYISGTLKESSTMHIAYEWLEQNGVPQFKWGERKKFLEEKGFKDKDYENAQAFIRKGIAPERISRHVKITKEMAFLFGLYLAEGSCSKSHIHMAHNIKEKHLFEEAAKGAEQIHQGINSTFKRKGNTNGAESHIYSKPVADLVRGLFGEGSHTKSIPDFFADLDKEILSHLLKGYFAGDGNSINDSSHNRKSNNDVYKVCLTSVNLNILLQVRKLLMKYEIIAGIQSKGESKKSTMLNGQEINSGPAFSLVVRGVHGVKLGKLLGYSDMNYEGKRRAGHSFFLDGYVCLRVINNITVEDVKEVWGFEVGEDNSFCVAGVATHNTSLPKGEMRMPGRGYESLYDLHPDEYGRYGSFDRMRILADIAPTSHEYKVWRDIANKTVQDPELRQEMEDIKERVKKQNKNYEFFDYQFLGRGTDRQKVFVDEVIDNNHFTVVGSEQVYSMAGIELGSRKQSGVSLSDYITPGSEILLVTDKNEYTGTNDDQYQSVSAAVYVGGENINQMLVNEGFAEKRGDPSSAATMANFTDFQIMRGRAYEALSHLPIPYFSQKFFKIRDPLESWKQEFTYGTSYASWTNPIETFLMPGIERSLMSDTEIAIGAGLGLLSNYMDKNSSSKLGKLAATGAFALGNRGAFIGGFLALSTGATGSTLKKAMNIGAVAQIGAWAFTRRDEVLEGTVGAAGIGAVIGNAFGDIGKVKGGIYGAAIGLAVTGMNSSVLSDGLNNEYIPERTKDKWETQEYFDRLTYLKYSGLYEKAARKAKALEGVDIDNMVDNYEKSQEKNFELRMQLEDAKEIVQRAYNATDERGARLLQEIDDKLRALETSEFAVSVGSYGKSALMYKQMMDSTVYGLSRNASWAELVRAVPQNERDHFIEFFKEKDPEKQKELLKYVSPYTRKILKIAWGQEPDDLESNTSYFKDKHLPGPFWSGWRPDIDLKDVQVKTIQNEGMLLADFGFYESQLRDPNVINAPSINPHGSQDPLTLMASISTTLKGMGLAGVNVNVSPSSKSGVEVMANIINTAAGAPAYLEKKIQNILSF